MCCVCVYCVYCVYMCLCMCVLDSACVRACVRGRVGWNTEICHVRACERVRRACVRTFVRACACACVRACVCARACVCVCARACVLVYTCVRACVHACATLRQNLESTGSNSNLKIFNSLLVLSQHFTAQRLSIKSLSENDKIRVCRRAKVSHFLKIHLFVLRIDLQSLLCMLQGISETLVDFRIS